MIESYLQTGSQPITADPTDLKYGLSITDPCLGWDMTASALAEAYKLLGERHHCGPAPAAGSSATIVTVPKRSDKGEHADSKAQPESAKVAK